jgi:hypothetical protein
MAATPPQLSPTASFYAALQSAFDHFNADLFDGKLPQCLIGCEIVGEIEAVALAISRAKP